MRISVTQGGNSVDLYIKGHSTKTLLMAEAVATRLLQAAPAEPLRPPVGFAAVPTLSVTDVADQDEEGDDSDRTLTA